MAAFGTLTVTTLTHLQTAAAAVVEQSRRLADVNSASQQLADHLRSAIPDEASWEAKLQDNEHYINFREWKTEAGKKLTEINLKVGKLSSSSARRIMSACCGAISGRAKVLRDLDELSKQFTTRQQALTQCVTDVDRVRAAAFRHSNVPKDCLGPTLDKTLIRRIAGHFLADGQVALVRLDSATSRNPAVIDAPIAFAQLAQLSRVPTSSTHIQDWGTAQRISEQFKQRHVCYINAATIPDDNPAAQERQDKVNELRHQLNDVSPQPSIEQAKSACRQLLGKLDGGLIAVSQIGNEEFLEDLYDLVSDQPDIKVVATFRGCKAGAARHTSDQASLF